MAAIDYQQLCVDVVEIALEAGSLIRDARQQTHSNTESPGGAKVVAIAATSKKNTADIVTETDQASEHLIRTRLATLYPSIHFIGEESFKNGDTITNGPTFIVDPIDGTSNFVHGLPEVCVSIALVVQRQPTVGVVHNPFTSEIWSAVRGHGAFYRPYSNNNSSQSQQLPFSRTPMPKDGLRGACIGIEFGSDRQGPDFELNLAVFTKLLRTKASRGLFVNSLRAMGSAALAICRVAAGQQEAFWECGCWQWDVAAAWCILLEAGGIMVDGNPGSWTPEIDNRRYLAVRPATSREQQEGFVREFWSACGNMRSTYGPPSI